MKFAIARRLAVNAKSVGVNSFAMHGDIRRISIGCAALSRMNSLLQVFVGVLAYAERISCTATLNIITATIKSSRRQVAGRASQGASQAAPMARVENHSSDALAAPAT